MARQTRATPASIKVSNDHEPSRGSDAGGRCNTRSGKRAELQADLLEDADDDEIVVSHVRKELPTRQARGQVPSKIVDNDASTQKTASKKRKAPVEHSKDDEPAPRGKKARKASQKDADEDASIEFSTAQSLSCSLIMECELQSHEKHSCITKINADFFLKASGGQKQKRIGEIVTYLVDMPNAGKGKSRTGDWISQILAPKEDRDEPQLIFQTIFTDTGAVRKPFASHRPELSTENLLFIHTFIMDPAYAGTGIPQDAMNAFLQALPNLPDDWGYTGAIVLSPAADAEVKEKRVADGTWKGDQHAEDGLIASWKKSGFEVWLRGAADVENSVTIMGRSGQE
jgi:hypothetical protein